MKSSTFQITATQSSASEEEDVKYLTFDITERATKSPGETTKYAQTIVPMTKGPYGFVKF